MDSVIEVAKKELRWECDYIREAECTSRFKELVKPYPDFYVPEVIPELSTPQVQKLFFIDRIQESEINYLSVMVMTYFQCFQQMVSECFDFNWISKVINLL